SRIAVHGWFAEPAVILSEAIEEPQQRRVFEATLAMLLQTLRDVDGVHGHVTARVDLSSEGEVADSRIVSSSLISTGDDSAESIERAIIDFLASSSFPPPQGEGWAVIPVSLPVEQGQTEREG
ncbi:MAG TPA: hypothetical protein VKA41_07545, partial [Solirubrobacterales bacterium]|nr:hypothetical protein [Solirubrobacterales bacterium]